MKRIAIIGCGGSGKSTLAQELHRRTGLPVFHLDREFFQPGWIPVSADEFQSRTDDIYQRDEWIIEGLYHSTLDARLARADTVFHLDYSTTVCLYRLLKRITLGHGKDRPDCAEGCPEQFDFEFLKYVATFRSRKRQLTLDFLAKHPHLKIHQFRTPKSLAIFLESQISV